MKLDRQQVTNILTLIVVGVWVVFALLDIWFEVPHMASLNSAMLSVIGYWFVSSAMSKKDDKGTGEYVGEHRLAI